MFDSVHSNVPGIALFMSCDEGESAAQTCATLDPYIKISPGTLRSAFLEGNTSTFQHICVGI